jgi:asparagine synthase (glutamine-hydrolysing)
MCGIAGIYRLLQHRAASTDAAEVVRRMLNLIRHRGPDDEGTLHDGELSFGMRRLSIIDLADGHQPIFDESGRYAVIFNGEIYNYQELRSDLIAKGHHFKTNSDTEVIVHLFEDHREGCLDYLRGMFAIAIWDHQRRELFIARDRLGVKPLYYTNTATDFLFASEIKSLLQHPEVQARPNLEAISNYLSLKYAPAPQTMFDQIHALPPGHYMTVHSRGVTLVKYWDLPYATESDTLDRGISDREYEERLLALLKESVRLRLRSDVPFGAFLSGGLDSSTIVALMANELSGPVNTFSVGFSADNHHGREEADELPYAQTVADHFGCNHFTLRITSEDFLKHAETVLWHLDQPIADQATVATFMVAKLAREHVKMVLTGEGGDELFAGYARYSGERWARYTQWIPHNLGSVIRSVAQRLPGLRRAKIGLSALTRSNEAERMANWFPMFSDDLKQQLISSAYSPMKMGAMRVFAETLSRCKSTQSLNRMLYVDTKLWLPDYLLLRGDKLTMAHSLEARLPLLDHKLVEFAARLPSHLKLAGNKRKVLLRNVAAKLLPSKIIDRPKQGFPIPIERWLQKEAKPLLLELLSTENLRKRGLFNPGFVSNMIQQHLMGYADHSICLWGLMSLEMWYRKFIDSRDYIASTPFHETVTVGMQ